MSPAEIQTFPELPEKHEGGKSFFQPPAGVAAAPGCHLRTQPVLPNKTRESVFAGVVARYTLDLPPWKEWARGWQCPLKPEEII